MTLLVLSPDFSSHYGPLAVLAGAVRQSGARVVVATGRALRERVESDGFEWRLLQLGAASNDGIAGRDLAIRRFIAATALGPVATLRLQALERERDLLWQPEQVAADVARTVRRDRTRSDTCGPRVVRLDTGRLRHGAPVRHGRSWPPQPTPGRGRAVRRSCQVARPDPSSSRASSHR